MLKDVVEKTKVFAQTELFADSSGHDWWHVHRVWSIARRISEIEGANTNVVELAALLHDISDYKLNGGDDTAATEIARNWLEQLSVEHDVIDQTCEVIRSLGFKAQTDPVSLEAKIILDADRLDAIGAIGIARAFAFGGFKGHAIHRPGEIPTDYRTRKEYVNRSTSSITHFYEKLLRLRDLMYTQTAQRVAERRHQVLLTFLDEFFLEWDGRDVSE